MSSLLDVHRWRRMGWPRIAMYIVFILFLVHLFSSFLISSNTNITTTTTTTAIPESIQEFVLDFPWYKAPGHPRLDSLQDPKYTTTGLSTTERMKLTTDQVLKARELAQAQFNHIQGIPGSIFDRNTRTANQFRSLVNCWTSGKWVKVPLGQGLLPHFQDPLYGSCDRKFYKHNSKGQREAVKYIWRSDCDSNTDSIDGQNWCRVLNGRHILLVGDLVQYQLHELFLDALRDGPAVCFGELNCKEHTLCTAPFVETRLRYLRNDILSIRRKMDQNQGHPKADVIEWPFTSASNLRNFPIMILNRAPVIESDDEFIKGLIETLRTIRKGNPNSLILYRSTGIGHPFCDDATEPLETPLTDQELKLLPFGWSEVSRRNAIARVIVEAAGGVFIDLAALTDLRPDGHVGGQDCLRYCMPGPLDSWAQILYQVFLGLLPSA